MTVAKYENFSKAAEELYISQPSISKAVLSLEKELDVPLFQRRGKRVQLNEAGLALKRKLEPIMSILDNLSRDLKVAAGHSRSTIVFNVLAASSLLPDILLRYAQRHPQVRLVVKVSDYPEDTTLKVARGEIDFLIMLEEQNARPEFRTVTSIYQPLVFLTYPDNPILERGPLTLAGVVENQFIVADREIGYSALLEKQLRQEGIVFQPVMEMGSVSAILQVLLGGYGITFVPAFAASSYLESGQLVSIDCEKISFDMYANYICSKDRWMNPAMQEFVKVVEEYA